MAAMAATVRKFQSLRIQLPRRQWHPTAMTSKNMSSSTTQPFSSFSSSWLPQSTATTLSSNGTLLRFLQQGCSNGKTMKFRNFSSFRPPPPSPRPPSSPSQSRTGGPPSNQQSRLQRPPSISLGRIPPKIRVHAVSLFHGDYEDKDTERIDWSGMGPLRYEGEENEGDDDGDLDGSRAREEEALLRAEQEDEDDDNADWTNDDDEMSMSDKWLIRSAKQRELAQMEKKKKWIANAQPKTFVAKIDARGRSYGRGGRKTSHARVWIQPGLGNVVVNRKDFVEYFTRDTDREKIVMPFVVTGTAGQFDVQAYVAGGGTSGQAGAVRHGVARALQNYNPESYRRVLKKFGFLTRDPRQVERKKVAHLKARKKSQWNRR